MRILHGKFCTAAPVLLALACLPVATHADSSLTLDGAPIESVSFGTDTFSVVMDSAATRPEATSTSRWNSTRPLYRL
jgi:hypothetical protein